jgi:hypothetical protein
VTVGRATFGDFLDAAREHLGSSGVLRRAASRGGDVQEISHSLLRVVIVMGRYVQDVSTAPGQAPSQPTPVTAAWGRAGLDARSALTSAALLLHGDIPARRQPARPASSELARRLNAAALSLTTGRDLLQTHVAQDPDGAGKPRSPWWNVINSQPVTRALLTEMALLARDIAPLGLWVASPAGTRGSPETRRRLNAASPRHKLTAACEWLQFLGDSVRAAHQQEPVSAGDLELLRTIPASRLPARQLPDGSEPVTGLSDGVINAAERARHAAWASATVPPGSPAVTVSSWRRVAAASTLTGHHCAILLRSLADRTQDGGRGELTAGLFQAADAAGRASARWLLVAHALDDVTTDTQGQRSEAAVGASDLALWTGRLAYSDPQWTLTSGPRHEARPPRSLAPEPGDIPLAVAALHHACDAMTRLAYADRDQVKAAAAADRILVAITAPLDIWDAPRPYGPVLRGQIDAMVALYDYAGDASAQATASAADAATAVRAPRRVLAAAGAALDARHPGRPEPALNAAAAPTTASQPREQPGPIEASLQRLGVTSPRLLRRGAEVDRAGEQLIIEAAAEHEQRDEQPSAETPRRSAGTVPPGTHIRGSGDPSASAFQGGRASLQREPPEAEP